jgi:hypothetical protein
MILESVFSSASFISLEIYFVIEFIMLSHNAIHKQLSTIQNKSLLFLDPLQVKMFLITGPIDHIPGDGRVVVEWRL